MIAIAEVDHSRRCGLAEPSIEHRHGGVVSLHDARLEDLGLHGLQIGSSSQAAWAVQPHRVLRDSSTP